MWIDPKPLINEIKYYKFRISYQQLGRASDTASFLTCIVSYLVDPVIPEAAMKSAILPELIHKNAKVDTSRLSELINSPRTDTFSPN